MPLYQLELNRLADDIVASDITVRLHTVAPTDANPTNGRTTQGGGNYASGVVVAAANWSAAASGDVSNNNAIDFGTASANVGTVVAWSAYRGVTPVAFGTLPSTTINDGDSFSINAGSLQINGNTT